MAGRARADDRIAARACAPLIIVHGQPTLLHSNASAPLAKQSCDNCGASLTGPYCAQCGQHAHESARSLGLLLHEVWHLFTHVDGQLWGTLGRLLGRPGELTLEYFADRRARYVPPFRLYLVMSVIFFGLTALTTQHDARIALVRAPSSLSAADLAELRREIAEAQQQASGLGQHLQAGASGVNVNFGVQDCDRLHLGGAWLTQRLRTACRKDLADSGQSLLHSFGAHVPQMMFVFLPLMALIMVPLYLDPRRFYVEHLVFFLHTQAALFLVMALDLMLHALARWLTPLQSLTGYVDTAVFAYALWYVYRSMRRYYAERRSTTGVKFTLVAIAYFGCLMLTMLGTLMYSALLD
jgi:hypothetical protein